MWPGQLFATLFESVVTCPFLPDRALVLPMFVELQWLRSWIPSVEIIQVVIVEMHIDQRFFLSVACRILVWTRFGAARRKRLRGFLEFQEAVPHDHPVAKRLSGLKVIRLNPRDCLPIVAEGYPVNPTDFVTVTFSITSHYLGSPWNGRGLVLCRFNPQRHGLLLAALLKLVLLLLLETTRRQYLTQIVVVEICTSWTRTSMN